MRRDQTTTKGAGAVHFEVARTTVRGYPALAVRGELDLTTAPALAAVVDTCLGELPRALVIDLTGATFLDSSGARQLVLTARAAADRGVPLQIVCPADNGPVRLPIDLLKLHTVVPIVESAAELDGGFAEGQAGP